MGNLQFYEFSSSTKIVQIHQNNPRARVMGHGGANRGDGRGVRDFLGLLGGGYGWIMIRRVAGSANYAELVTIINFR